MTDRVEATIFTNTFNCKCGRQFSVMFAEGGPSSKIVICPNCGRPGVAGIGFVAFEITENGLKEAPPIVWGEAFGGDHVAFKTVEDDD